MQLEKMDAFFENRLNGYEAHMLKNIASAEEFYPFTAENLPHQPGAKILDLGCGTGLELRWYYKNNPTARITGIDLSAGMLQELRKNYPEKELELICGSYFDMPLGECIFDAAVSVESLHHFTQEEKIPLYQKLYDSLKAGGYFILTDYFSLSDEEEKFHRQNFLQLKQEQGIDKGFYHYDTPLTVEHEIEALIAAGFLVEVLQNWGATYTLKATKNEHIREWKAEEEIAHIHGWDFSHLDGRCVEEPLPWDYRQTIEAYLKPEMKLLDIDTGGGEFLLRLNHPYENTAATENYPPNIALCKEILLPLGIDFRPADGAGKLPFADNSFHMVIDRHGDFNPTEIYQVLKPGGIFVTQQVGAENDREFVELLCGKTELPFPGQYADKTAKSFQEAGFSILRQEECFRPIRFYDVGALVWFARILPWEFPNFSVDTHLENLVNAQHILEQNGCIAAKTHRFLIVAKK